MLTRWKRTRTRPLTNVILVTIKNGLVAASVLADVGEGLDNTQPQPLPLLTLVDSDILDVANSAETTDKFAFHNDSASSDNLVCDLINDDEGVVRLWRRTHGLEMCYPRILPEIINHGENR